MVLVIKHTEVKGSSQRGEHGIHHYKKRGVLAGAHGVAPPIHGKGDPSDE